MVTKVMVFPHRYVQGPGVLSSISEHLSVLSISHPLFLTDSSIAEICRRPIEDDLNRHNISSRFLLFNGESTWNEVARVKTACIDGGHDAIISCGGGKTLDTGRAAAAENAMNCGIVPPQPIEKLGAGVACVQIPTIASTDAPTSRACLIYDDQGAFETVVFVPINPEMVIVDTQIISKGPVRTFVAGMGDALATFFEADTCCQTKSVTPAGGKQTLSAHALSKLAYEILMTYGLQAKEENEAKIAGPAIEAVVEANTLLSGLGFENGGLSAAHAVADCLTLFNKRFKVSPMHGEMVSYGTVVHLLLENRDTNILNQVIEFCKSVGLPTTLRSMGLKKISDQVLKELAVAVSKDPLIRSMPNALQTREDDGVFYESEIIFQALKKAEAL